MSEPGLVQPEGVNAATSDVEDEALHPQQEPGDVRSGGDPADGDHTTRADTTQDNTQNDEQVGVPEQDGDEPGQELATGEG